MDVLQEKEKMMRDYWLNSLGDNQVERLETEWFGSDDDSELLEIVRADLIDDYISNSLNKTDYLQFEKHFLPNNLQDIILAKSSIDISSGNFEEPKKKSIFERFSETVRNFASIPQVALAVLFLACFGLLAGYFIKFYNNEPQQIARNIEPEIDKANKIQNEPKVIENSNISNKTNVNTEIVKESGNSKIEPKNINPKIEKDVNKAVNVEPKPQNENKPGVEEKPVIKQQILLLTTLRGSGKPLTVSNSVENVLLKLDMPGIDKLYKNYEVRIYDSNNNLVVNLPINENLSLKKSGDKISIPSLKTNKFKKNITYKTTLFGIDEKKDSKELCVYDSFKVN